MPLRFAGRYQAALVCALVCRNLGDDETLALKQEQPHLHKFLYHGRPQGSMAKPHVPRPPRVPPPRASADSYRSKGLQNELASSNLTFNKPISDDFPLNFVGHERSRDKNEADDDSDDRDNGKYLASLGALAKAHAPILKVDLVSQARNLSLLAQDATAASAVRAKLFSALRHALGEATQLEAATSDHEMDRAPSRGRTAHDRFSAGASAYFKRRLERSPFASDPFASSRFCKAQCIAVQDSKKASAGDRSWEPRTAVCLVGMVRTMTRPDVRDGFRFNLLAGWGDRRRGLFVVIARNAKDEAEPDREQVEGFLGALG